MELMAYLYDPETFAFTKEVSVGEDDALPDNSTKWPPPECAPNQQAYYNGDGWVKAFPLALMTSDRLRSVYLAVAALKLEREVRKLGTGAPNAETSTYSQQYMEAKEFQRTKQAPVFLEALAISRGEEVESLAAKIVAKAEVYNTRKAELLAAYQLEVKELMISKDLKLTQELLRHPLLMVA
jgi:hypothetical protein